MNLELLQVLKNQPVMITGAYGMLGSDLVDAFKNELGSDLVLASDYDTLDITNAEALSKYIELNKPSVIINAAAYTDVDGAESEREKAYLINTQGPKVLASEANRANIQLIHFTTDYVFDGTGQTPWTEEHTPNPPQPNYYGETKLWGEQEVLKFEKNLVLRVQWLYGKKRDRFTTLKNKEVFTPFMDQYGAPTWTKQVCEVVIALIVKEATGLLHFSYDDYASWSEVFQFVCDEMKFSTKLIPKKTSEVSLAAKRPLFGAMSNRKLLRVLGRESLGSWKEPLREFLKQAQK